MRRGRWDFLDWLAVAYVLGTALALVGFLLAIFFNNDP